ncbi:MAG: hypothetical protein Q9213_001141 [Squamulea squamosa]
MKAHILVIIAARFRTILRNYIELSFLLQQQADFGSDGLTTLIQTTPNFTRTPAVLQKEGSDHLVSIYPSGFSLSSQSRNTPTSVIGIANTNYSVGEYIALRFATGLQPLRELLSRNQRQKSEEEQAVNSQTQIIDSASSPAQSFDPYHSYLNAQSRSRDLQAVSNKGVSGPDPTSTQENTSAEEPGGPGDNESPGLVKDETTRNHISTRPEEWWDDASHGPSETSQSLCQIGDRTSTTQSQCLPIIHGRAGA